MADKELAWGWQSRLVIMSLVLLGCLACYIWQYGFTFSSAEGRPFWIAFMAGTVAAITYVGITAARQQARRTHQ